MCANETSLLDAQYSVFLDKDLFTKINVYNQCTVIHVLCPFVQLYENKVMTVSYVISVPYFSCIFSSTALLYPGYQDADETNDIFVR